MYAIIEDSGRQFKVSEGDRIEVEIRDGAKAGDALVFDKVLFVGGEKPAVGAPYVVNARVKGQIESEFKARKVVAFKYQRREPYHRKVGHRQQQLRVRITEIALS